MARITGSSSKNNYGFFVDVWDTEVSGGTDNRSKVGFNLYIQNNNHRFNGSNYTVNMTIDGTNYGTTKDINTTTVGQTDACLILSGTSNWIGHAADGSKSVYISASVSRSSYSSYDGGYMELGGWFTLQKIDRYFSSTPTLTYVSAEETTMNFNWSTSETCSQAVLYRNGTAIQTKSVNSTSGSFDKVTGLSANTSYQWYVKCTRKDSGMASDSTTQAKSTYPYPSINSITTSSGTMDYTLPAPGTNISQTVTLNNPLNRTNITVYAKKDSTSGTQFGSATNSSSALVNVPLTLTTNTMYSSIPSATSGTVVYYCVYNDGSNHTSVTVSGIFRTSASNCGPTVSADPTYTNSTNAHATLVGLDTIIQGQSSFTVTSPTITTRGSATVAKYYFKIGSGNYESTGTTNSKTYSSTSLSGSVIAYCYAEDSRGYTSAVKQVTMRVLPYSIPTATITVSRNGYSTNGTIAVSATRSSLSKSSATSTDVNNWRGNTSSNKILYAITPNDASPNSGVIGGTGTSSSGSVNITDLNLEKSYTITVNISDRVTTLTKTVTIDKAAPVLSMNAVSSSIGINTMVDDNTTDKLIVNGSSNLQGIVNITNYLKTAEYGKFENGVRGKSINSGGGTSGYFYVCDITNNSTYCNQYLQFDIIQRGRIGHVELQFANSGTTGALTVSKINKSGTSNVYYTCVDNIFKLYVQKSESYDDMEIVNLEMGNHGNKLLISWKNQTITSLPSGYITVNEGCPSMLGMYPVGSIYISVNNVNPSTYFGGTWEAFGTGKTLVGVDTNDTDFNTVQKTGGVKTNSYTPAGTINNHALTINELPNVTGDAWANFVCHQDGSTSSGVLSYEYGGKSGAFTSGDRLPFGHIKINFGSGWGHNHGWTGTAANISTVQPYVTVYMWKRTA